MNKLLTLAVLLGALPLVAQTPRGYLITPAELSSISAKSALGTQPYADAVKAMLNYANTGNFSVANSTQNPTYWPSGANYQSPYTVASLTCPDLDWMQSSNTPYGGATITWAKVLAWKLTGNTAYADNAIIRLRNVYVTTEANGFTFGGTNYGGGNDCILALAHGVNDYIMAADMLEGYSGWTATDKTNLLNWLGGTVFKKVKFASDSSANNWGSAGGAAEATIADYDYAGTVALLDRNGARVTPAAAWAEAKQHALDRMGGTYNGVSYGSNGTWTANTGCASYGNMTLSGTNYSGARFHADGGIAEELQRAGTAAANCQDTYMLGPQYPNCTGSSGSPGADNGYQGTHLQGSLNQAELYLRRGDSSLYDFVQPQSDLPAIQKAARFMFLNPNSSGKSCDVANLAERGWVEWAYRHYKDSLLYNELTTVQAANSGGTIDKAATGGGTRYIGDAKARMVHFATLLAGFAVTENPGLPPVSAMPPGITTAAPTGLTAIVN